jgi:hypothetical protein
MARKKNGAYLEIDDLLDRNRRLIQALRNLNEKICCEGGNKTVVQEFIADTDLSAGVAGHDENSN